MIFTSVSVGGPVLMQNIFFIVALHKGMEGVLVRSNVMLSTGSRPGLVVLSCFFWVFRAVLFKLYLVTFLLLFSIPSWALLFSPLYKSKANRRVCSRLYASATQAI